MRNCYLSHWSALQFWKASLVQAYFQSHYKPEIPADVTVFKTSHYYRRKNLRVHLCTSKVQRGAKMHVRGQQVISPEFAYMQLAAQLAEPERILLGILLCAKPHDDASQQVTTRKKLLSFVRKAKRQYGRHKAIQALAYVRDDCRSIMEALQYMFHSLPHRLGGCGFGEGVFNHRFILDVEGARALGQRSCYADVYWPQHGLVLEYDSLTHHSSVSAQGWDAERLATLSRHGPRGGLCVISVKPSQLYNLLAFQELFKYIAKRIGKRIRIRTSKYWRMHDKLRRLLPRRGTIVAEPSPVLI